MKPFTFQELWAWDKKYNTDRAGAIKEATDRGYRIEFGLNEKDEETWKLYYQDDIEPCATGHVSNSS